ncbi:MAG TPA: phosphatase PAP2 family protein [Verrucomicrobiae bacterium]|nr:phosphatase PAP2 family protein [Verrucomicrobiae bacterium]
MKSGYERADRSGVSPEHKAAGVSGPRLLSSYRFVDYATQAYVAVVGLLILVFHNRTVPHWGALVGAHAAVLVCLHLLVGTRSRTEGRPQPILRFLCDFYPVLLYAGFYAETGSLNRMFIQEYLDPMAIRCDQALFGFQPSLRFMEKLPLLAVSELFYASYFSYYIMIAGVGVALYRKSRGAFFHYISVVSFVFYICYLCYIVLPIIGPPVFFGHIAGYHLPVAYQALEAYAYYPKAVQSGPFYHLMGFIYRFFEAPGAALPSSHVAVALCTVFFSFLYLRPLRYPHLIVALLLCAATVYCRYHYVIDVLSGALTALLLVPLGTRLYRKVDGLQR